MDERGKGKPEGNGARRARDRLQAVPRWLRWTAGISILFLLLFAVASYFLAAPIGRWVEREMNARLEGYTVRIGDADLSLWGPSFALRDVVLTQDAYPDQPVARVDRMRASVHWRELLFANVVADLLIERPDVHIDPQQMRTEEEDEVDAEERGWLETLEATYPLRIDTLEVQDGSFAYVGEDWSPLLDLQGIQLRVEDIRNRSSPEGEFPSTFHLEARFADGGSAVFEGRADLLHEAYPALRAGYRIADVPVETFRALLSRVAGIYVNTGTFSTFNGEIELQPNSRRIHVRDMIVRGLHADYIHVPSPEGPEEPSPAPRQSLLEWMEETGTLLQLDRLLLEDADIGMVNRGEDPQYRAFFTDARMQIEDYSQAFLQGEGTARLEGRFMGSGPTVVTAAFRPEEEAGPNFDLSIQIEETPLTAMNDIFRAYGNFDVVGGYFTFFAEFSVSEGHIDGYMRPFFGDVEVYDRRQAEEKGMLRRLYERAVGALTGLMENDPREEVATHVEVSGPLDDPNLSTWEIVSNLIRNAFLQAILPGFEQHAQPGG